MFLFAFGVAHGALLTLATPNPARAAAPGSAPDPARAGITSIDTMIEAAWEVVPEVGELELVEAGAGLRPGTPDNAAVVGPGELEGLVWATGHWRNGVLLTPLTGEVVAGLLAGGVLPEALAPLDPARFAEVRA